MDGLFCLMNALLFCDTDAYQTGFFLYLQQKQVYMNIVLPAIWILFFLFIIWKHPFFKLQGFAQWIIVGLFVCKLCASFVLNYIYTDYYHCRSDVFKYYNDAVALFDSIHYSLADFLRLLFGIDMDNPSLQQYLTNTDDWTREFNYGYMCDNQAIIRVNMLIMFFSWGNHLVHYVFADFISLISYVLIYKAFAILYGNRYVLFALIFLVPSSILWNAAMLKEVLVMLGLALAFYGMVNMSRGFSWKYVLVFIFGLVVLLGIKIYVLVALLPAFIAFAYNYIVKSKHYWQSYVLICVVGVVLLGILDFGFHKLPFFESFAGKRGDSINLAVSEQAGSLLPIGKIDPTPWNFLKETPVAIWNAIALPYIWNFKGVLQFVPALESLLLFILIALVIFFYKKPKESQKNFIWFCIFFSVVLIWEIGISTAVVGGIVRYKIPLFPFLYTTLAMLVDWRKIGIQNS